MKIYSGLVNQKHMGVASPPYTDWAIFFYDHWTSDLLLISFHIHGGQEIAILGQSENKIKCKQTCDN